MWSNGKSIPSRHDHVHALPSSPPLRAATATANAPARQGGGPAGITALLTAGGCAELPRDSNGSPPTYRLAPMPRLVRLAPLASPARLTLR